MELEDRAVEMIQTSSEGEILEINEQDHIGLCDIIKWFTYK